MDIPYFPGSIGDITLEIFQWSGVVPYKMSMVSKEWNVFCTAIYTANTTSNEPLKQAIVHENILWIIGHARQFTQDELMKLACQTANKLLIDILIKKGNDKWDSGLYGAAFGGHSGLVELMFKLGATDTEKGMQGACLGGDNDTVMAVLKRAKNRYSHLRIGLIYASKGGHMEIAKLMISMGAENINEGLYRACKGGHTELVRYLLSVDTFGIDMALYGACKKGRATIVQMLIDAGATKFAFGLQGACDGGQVEMARLMVERGAQFTERELPMACHNGNIDVIRYLISLKNVRYNYQHAFRCACAHNHKDVVQLFLDMGTVDINNGMVIAGLNNHVDLARWLISKGANEDVDNLLIWSCENGNIDIVELMIDSGAAHLNDGLRLACLRNHIDIIKLLIISGADDWNAGLEGACKGNNIDVVRLMIEYGAEYFDRGMEAACKRGLCHIALLLLNSGANEYEFYIRVAKEYNHNDIIDLIIDFRDDDPSISDYEYTDSDDE